MGKTVERVITVEYLEPSMSRELLCKFPDESAFDFDYSQSSIWSPLPPRAGGGNTAVSRPCVGARRLFSEGYERRMLSQERLSKVQGKIKKKTTTKKNAVAKKVLGFSTVSSTPNQGWSEVLRAATRHFKKQRSPL